MNQEKTYNENSQLTVGILREILREEVGVQIKKELKPFVGRMDTFQEGMDGFREEFSLAEERSSRSSVRIMNELAENRHAIEHLGQEVTQVKEGLNMYRQEVQADSRSIIKSEIDISELDARVLKLETAK